MKFAKAFKFRVSVQRTKGDERTAVRRLFLFALDIYSEGPAFDEALAKAARRAI
jgi:hypothetical protein